MPPPTSFFSVCRKDPPMSPSFILFLCCGVLYGVAIAVAVTYLEREAALKFEVKRRMASFDRYR